MSKEEFNIPEQKVQSESQKLMGEFLSRPDFNNIDWNKLSDETPQNQGITLAWQAVDLACIGQTALLEKLLSCPPAIMEKIDWNACPLDEKRLDRGETVVWWATILAAKGQPALLEKLLACSPAVLEKIDWNACPQDEKHIDRGETVAWRAIFLNFRGQPALLEKLLACSPAILKKIDWNACPQNEKRIRRGMTVFWSLAGLAHEGQSAPLEKLLACSPTIMEKIDWNACPQNEKRLDRGETLARRAISLAYKYQPALLGKLLACSPAIMEKIDWNACPQNEKRLDRGETLAWWATALAAKGQPALLEKLLTCSPAVLEKIDWNACPQDEKHPNRGQTVAWQTISLVHLSYLSYIDPSALLEKLLACSPAVLEKIDWNACPQNENHMERGVTIAWDVFSLACIGQAALLEKLLTCSQATLEKIDWNACPQDEKHFNRGQTVAWQAISLVHLSYLSYKDPSALLEKLLACSQATLEKIDWNARPQNENHIERGVTIAGNVISLACTGKTALLEKLLTCSPSVLEKIDWNARPLGRGCFDRDETVAWQAISLACIGQAALLEKLLPCSQAILEKIDWNACPLDEKRFDRGQTVAWRAISLATKGQPVLLKKLLACSQATLEKIDWNACPPRDVTITYNIILLAAKGRPALLEKLLSLSPAILENIDWCPKPYRRKHPPASLLRRVFTQNNARLFFLLLEWSAPALQNLKTALLLAGLTASEPLLRWIDFSLLVNPQKKPATQSLLTQLDEEEKYSEEKSIPDADEIEKVLENIKKVLPNLHGKACLHTGRQWLCLRQRFYSVIPLASPDYGTAQWELANMYLNERDEKEIPVKRELRLKKALYAASRCWFHEIRISPDSDEEQGRPLVQVIVKAILGWPPGELTCDLPVYVESLLNEDAQYYATHRQDLRLHALDLKITNLWLSLKIFLNDEKYTAMLKLIAELQKNIVIDDNPHQADQKGTGQNRKRKNPPSSPPQADFPGLFSSPRLGLLPDNSHSSTDSSSSHSKKQAPA